MEEETQQIFTVAPAEREYYANFFNVTFGVSDVRLGFGRYPGEIPIKIDTEILLALPTLKQLHEAIGNVIQQYENAFGLIALEPISLDGVLGGDE